MRGHDSADKEQVMSFPKPASARQPEGAPGSKTGRLGGAASRSTLVDFNSLSPGEWATGSSHTGVFPGITIHIGPYDPVALLNVGISKPFVSRTALGCSAGLAAVMFAFDAPHSRVTFGALWGGDHATMPEVRYAKAKIVDPDSDEGWVTIDQPVQQPGQQVTVSPLPGDKIWGIVVMIYEGDLIDNFELTS
jgi:hypothetical protein